MIWMYNFVINLYSLGAWLASFFNKKANLWVKGRKGIFTQLEAQLHNHRSFGDEGIVGDGGMVGDRGMMGDEGMPGLDTKNQKPETNNEKRVTSYEKPVTSNEKPETRNQEPQTKNQKLIWLHVASLGEFEQGRPVIEKIKENFPGYKILLTFFSPSGYEIRKNYELADYVFYLPVDTRKNARRFIEIVQPKLVIFVKYEFWYHFLNTLQTKGIPTLLVSALFRPDQVFFKWYGGLFKKILEGFDHIFVQNEASFLLLKKHNYQQITLAGDTRVDRVDAIAAQTKRFEIIEKFAGENNILICGSTWPPDEVILAEFIKNNDRWKFIIAPHEIKESNIQRLQKLLPENTVRYSKSDEKSVLNKQVLIIDNIGMLSSIYRYGKVAYIGGGFGKGIHNTLEPIAFGLPVIFGPKFKKFEEAVTLVEKGGGFTISNYADFIKIMTQLSEERFYNMASQEAQNYISKNRGATEKIIQHLSRHI